MSTKVVSKSVSNLTDEEHSSSVTPASSSMCPTPLRACIGEPLLSESDYGVHEFRSE